MKRLDFATLFCAVSTCLGIARGGDEVVPNQVTLPMTPFELTDVRLLDGPFKAAQQTDLAWLMRIDPDRLLYNFRATGGLPSFARP